MTILVRDRAKAEALFPDRSLLTIVEGDAQDAQRLNQLGAVSDCIVHAINHPYDKWFGTMDTVTQNVIEAASQNQATVVLPGNIYPFGIAKEPIRESSKPNPCTRKGKRRVAIEAMLETAAKAGQCRVINVRFPDFWGPNVLNESVKPIFINALTGKALPWLLNADSPHQIVYTLDAAEILIRLLLREWTARQQSAKTGIPPYEVWNYGGTTVPSMRTWFGAIASLTGKPLKVRVYSRFTISLLGRVRPVIREVKEMLYLYEHTILLDDSNLRALFPAYRPTANHKALVETLTWFANHELNRSFTPVTELTDSQL